MLYRPGELVTPFVAFYLPLYFTLACNGTIVSDTESKGMGEVIQLQGDQRKKIKDFLTDKEEGLGLDEKLIKVRNIFLRRSYSRFCFIPTANRFDDRSTASKPVMSRRAAPRPTA